MGRRVRSQMILTYRWSFVSPSTATFCHCYWEYPLCPKPPRRAKILERGQRYHHLGEFRAQNFTATATCQACYEEPFLFWAAAFRKTRFYRHRYFHRRRFGVLPSGLSFELAAASILGAARPTFQSLGTRPPAKQVCWTLRFCSWSSLKC